MQIRKAPIIMLLALNSMAGLAEAQSQAPAAPVAIDQASADLVNQAQGRKDSCLTKNFQSGKDKFRALYPNVDWEIQLNYAEQIGLGTRDYELKVI